MRYFIISFVLVFSLSACIRNVMKPYVEPHGTATSKITINLIENFVDAYGYLYMNIFDKAELCEGKREAGHARRNFPKTKIVEGDALVSLNLFYSEPGHYCDSYISFNTVSNEEYIVDYTTSKKYCHYKVSKLTNSGKKLPVIIYKREKVNKFKILSDESKFCEPMSDI